MSDNNEIKKFVNEAIGAVAGEVFGEAIDTSEVFSDDQSNEIGDAIGGIVEHFLGDDDEEAED
jgi:hypothetical protein